MKAILVDHEIVALNLLEKRIRELSDIKIIGKFINPIKAYEKIIQSKPEIIFTEIELPYLDGMTLARKVLDIYPDTNIVFVTSRIEYAVEAFEINAVDFLEKNTYTGRFKITINRLMKKRKKIKMSGPIICCFKALKFKQSLKSIQINVNWRTAKARELFAFLLHNRNETVRKDVIIDLLWPETDVKNALTQLYSTIYQIRKTLNQIKFPIEIISNNNQYRINMNGIKTDVDLLELGLKDFDIENGDLHLYKRLLRLYKGDYLEEDSYHWALSEQNRLRVLWTSYLTSLAEYYVEQRNYAEAIMLYLHYQSIVPYNEDVYFKLMQLFDKFGDRKSVEFQYHKLKNMLKEQFDDVPSTKVKQWYKKKIRKRLC
ncbi:two-component SAPR family response regulator [Cerasibacillus quisquiliarum]|uniref:Response regulatory domain-containing protein n=1 Tax=Cerasibacillus quisquiliarum TaxID=227865 RepID=A0A511UYE6_9BACI|nr:response regulator [Cerasibacillus quisquiliarum]MBB5144953.1 two-component SAPR family response regulator [Cerasibacillus quisquiliarum]GEN30152.1 hypothetical protein CQU01_03900 [Cerasibacillus quisquiliarum]